MPANLNEKYLMSQREELLSRVETKEAVVGIRGDGIIHVYYKAGTIITVSLQEKMLKTFIDLTQGERMPFLWEGGFNVRITKEARLNALTMEKLAPCSISAVVVKNWLQKIVAEFYYRLNSSNTIYKVTSDFNDGINWLHRMQENPDL
jgi:hypothetical protein